MATLFFNGEPITVTKGESLFEIADRAGQGSREIATSCSRAGACKECVVHIKRGQEALTPWSPEEAFLERASQAEDIIFRLACRARVIDENAHIEVETFKRKLDITTAGQAGQVVLEPWVHRINGAVHGRGTKLADHQGPVYCLAIDVGTTTVVMHVLDLETGATISVQAFENPQKFGGSDVMRRISYDSHYPGQLHRAIIGQINAVLRSLPDIAPRVFAVTIAGNATMRDIVFDLDVQSIGQSPYVSVTQSEMIAGRRSSTALWSHGRELGLAVHPRAIICGLPLISNHVGSDMTAVLATIPIHEHTKPFVVLDIGTNTEVVVGTRDRVICELVRPGLLLKGAN